MDERKPLSSHWNNRIIRHKHPAGDYLAVHEVFYVNGKPDMVTKNPIDITGATLKELMGCLEYIYRDCHKSKGDILDYESFGKPKKPKRKVKK